MKKYGRATDNLPTIACLSFTAMQFGSETAPTTSSCPLLRTAADSISYSWAFLLMTQTGCRRKFHFALHQLNTLPKADLSNRNITETSDCHFDQIADIDCRLLVIYSSYVSDARSCLGRLFLAAPGVCGYCKGYPQTRLLIFPLPELGGAAAQVKNRQSAVGHQRCGRRSIAGLPLRGL